MKIIPLIINLLLIMLVVLLFPGIAWAYTDPNLGGLIFQILFPIITVVTTGYFILRNRVRRLYHKLKNRSDKSHHEETP